MSVGRVANSKVNTMSVTLNESNNHNNFSGPPNGALRENHFISDTSDEIHPQQEFSIPAARVCD